jgi:hypothetical protein
MMYIIQQRNYVIFVINKSIITIIKNAESFRNANFEDEAKALQPFSVPEMRIVPCKPFSVPFSVPIVLFKLFNVPLV